MSSFEIVWIAALLALAHVDAACTVTNCNVQVAILGGGVAGVAAGKTLTDAGLTDFVIVEAGSKLGGRMKEVQFGPIVVEAGANWVQGTNRNPVYDLAHKYGLQTSKSKFSNNVVYDKTGQKVSKQNAWTAWDQTLTCAINYIVSLLSAGDPTLDNLSQRDVLLMCGWDRNSPPSGLTADVMDAVEYFTLDFEYAQDPNVTAAWQQSPSNTYTDFKDADLMSIDPRGYAYIVRSWAKEYFAHTGDVFTDPRLRLNERVTQIQHSKSRATISTQTASGQTRTITAKRVIITFSAGVLQEKVAAGSTFFSPSLSAVKTDALNSVPMGTLTKIFFQFASNFWDGKQYLITAGDRRDQAPIWMSLDTGSTDFFPGSNTLVCIVCGTRSAELEAMTDAQVKAALLPTLQTVYGPLPAVVNFYMPRWLSDPLFRGSYSNKKPGVTTADLQVYGQPEGVLHFSGEAACIRYNGFVHAGLLAGQKSANEVLQKLGYISVVPASWCDVSPASIPTAPKHTHKLKGYDSADDQAWLDAYDPYLNSTSASTSASSLSSESSTTPAVAGGVAAAVALAAVVGLSAFFIRKRNRKGHATQAAAVSVVCESCKQNMCHSDVNSVQMESGNTTNADASLGHGMALQQTAAAYADLTPR